MNNKEQNNAVVWRTLEHGHAHKDPDWFWGVGIVATAIAVLSIVGGNPLFAVVVVIGAITLFLHAIKIPQMIEVRVAERGVSVSAAFFPYEEIESFHVVDDENGNFIILKSKKILTPRIIVPLEEDAAERARDALGTHLKEEELEIPVSHRILEFLGL